MCSTSQSADGPVGSDLDRLQRRGQRLAILTQCVGVLPILAYQNGLILAYLTRLGLPGDTVLLMLGLPSIVHALLTLPLAHMGDRLGVARLGAIGVFASMAAFALLLLASWCVEPLMSMMLYAALVVHGLAQALFGSGWFALLRPLLAEDERGRFFARLRMSWQSVGIVVGLGLVALLQGEPGYDSYRLILGAIVALLFVRLWLYRGIPVLAKRTVERESLVAVLRRMAGQPDYLAFASYLFLLSACVGACPWLFGLLQKRDLGFSDGDVVLMGIMFAIGSLGGFFLSGRLVDRYGCKPIFLIGHGSFALLLCLVLLRELSPAPMIVTFGALTLLWGCMMGGVSIAVTSEIMGLAPDRNQAVAISGLSTMQYAGVAFSSFAGSRLIKLGVFAEEWSLFGLPYGPYDALLLLLAICIAVITVTLGLVPSVIPKTYWLPQQGGGH